MYIFSTATSLSLPFSLWMKVMIGSRQLSTPLLLSHRRFIKTVRRHPLQPSTIGPSFQNISTSLSICLFPCTPLHTTPLSLCFLHTCMCLVSTLLIWGSSGAALTCVCLNTPNQIYHNSIKHQSCINIQLFQNVKAEYTQAVC